MENVIVSFVDESDSNFENNWIEDEDYYQINRPDNSLRNITLIICYGILMFISLIGNTLVCCVIATTPKLKTTTNYLIFSLTVSDIMMTCFNIPFMCARVMLSNWPFSDWFCQLMPLISVSSVYISSFTMVAIGFHRYRSLQIKSISKNADQILMSSFKASTAISANFRSILLTRRKTTCHRFCSHSHHHHHHFYEQTYKARVRRKILIIWLLSFVLAVPDSMFNKVLLDYDFNGLIANRCKPIYPVWLSGFNMSLFLTLIVSITQFLIPTLITAILYYKIYVIINRQGKLAAHSNDEANRRRCKVKRKRITMLILIVFGFLFTWLPLTVYHLLTDFRVIHFHISLFLMLHVIAMSSACLNPFIYCFMNKDFKRRALQLIEFRLKFPLVLCLISPVIKFWSFLWNVNFFGNNNNNYDDEDCNDDSIGNFSSFRSPFAAEFDLKQFVLNNHNDDDDDNKQPPLIKDQTTIKNNSESFDDQKFYEESPSGRKLSVKSELMKDDQSFND